MAVVPITVASLELAARLESGLRSNAYYDSISIYVYLSNGGAELYDLFTAANQHYVISTYDFTTTGPASAITALPADFQQGHSLEIYPDVNGQTRTIRYLSNWLNRNQYGANVFALAPGGFDPVYTFLDSKIRFYPPQCVPAAPFRLYYTPMWTPFAVPRPIVMTTSDTVTNAGGFIQFTLVNGAFDANRDTGGTLTVTFNDPNRTFSVADATITSVAGTTIALTNAPWPGGSFTPSPTGTASSTSVGTRGTLPAYMNPWAEYLIVYAAIAINIDRQRGTGELERKLQALKGRISSVIAQRQEEPIQPPLSRGDVGPWGWNGGGWGW